MALMDLFLSVLHGTRLVLMTKTPRQAEGTLFLPCVNKHAN